MTDDQGLMQIQTVLEIAQEMSVNKFVALCEETAKLNDCSFEEAATAVATKYPNTYEAYRRNALKTHRWETDEG